MPLWEARARRKPRHAKVEALPAPGSQAGLRVGSTPHGPGGNGSAAPCPPSMAGPDDPAWPDDPAGTGWGSEARALVPQPDHLGGSGAAGRPAARAIRWADYLEPGFSHRAGPEHSGRRGSGGSRGGGSRAGAGTAIPADARAGDVRGGTAASSARLAESAEVPTREHRAAFDDDRIHIVRDLEEEWQVTDIGSDESVVRAHSAEDDDAEADKAVLAAPGAAAPEVGGSADGGRGRGSVRRSQWSDPPELPPPWHSAGQDEVGANPDGPGRGRVRRPALRIAVLAVAFVLVGVIGFMGRWVVSTGSRGAAAKHVASAGHSPPSAARRVALLALLPGITSVPAVAPAPVPSTAAAAHKTPAKPQAAAPSPPSPASPPAASTPIPAHRAHAAKARVGIRESGPIHGFNGMCLDVKDGRIANQQPVRLWSCNKSAAQKWYFDQRNNTIHLAAGTRYCLDVFQNGTRGTTPVELHSCATKTPEAQVWVPHPGGALYNPHSAMCLDDPAFSTTGAQLQIYPCNGGANQIWSLPPGVWESGPLHGFNGMCLDVKDGIIANQQPVRLWSCNKSAAQKWYFDQRNNTIHLAAGPRYCLDVFQNGTRGTTPVELYSCATKTPEAQVWVPQPGGALYNPHSAMCLDDPAFSTTGAQLQIYPCNGGANQNWSLP